MSTVAEQIQLVYVGLLGRAADKAGLDYWADEINSGVLTIEDLRANIVNEQPEYINGMGDMSRAQVVSQLYNNLFNREADEDGLVYWVDGAGSDVNVDQLVLALIEGAAAPDRLVLDNKADAASHYTEVVGDNYREPDARAAIESVDESAASVEASKVASDALGSNEVAFSDIAGSNDGYDGAATQTINDIGKDEWDAAGEVVTTAEDYTFTLSDQLGNAETYEGLFLSPLLTADDRTADSQLFIDLLDLRTADTARPLGDLPVNGFRFSVDGQEVVVESEEIFQAETYPQLLTAVQNAIAASDEPLLSGFQATLGGQFQATDDNGQVVNGTTLVLTDSNGGVIEQGNFTYSDDASAGGFTLYGEQSTEAPQTINELIETNLELDNIGYGSQGGTVNLVGQSHSDKGIEQINVSAENGVWLTRLESEAPESGPDVHFLKEVNLEGSGYFKVGAQEGERVQTIEELFGGGDYGLVDVQDFNGGSFEGEIKLNALITEDVIARDLNALDDADNANSDDEVFNYTTAAGDDQISLNLSDDLMAREDASVQISSGEGDDLVETVITNSGNDLTDQQLNANLTIATGGGDDVVRSWGQGDAVIGTGAGNDVVYADNSGVLSGVDRWEFNSTATAGAAPNGVSNSDAPLSDGASGVAQTYSVEEAASVQVQVSFKGHESVWVDVPTTRTAEGQDDTISTLQVNQAIKDAVNNDHVLANLLEASDGDGNILDIASLIDGDNLDELEIGFRDNNADTSADLSGLEGIYAEDGTATAGTESAATSAGADSLAESDNTITAGEGDDVLVLGTGALSNDTLVLSGEFGNDDIVNFTVGTGTGADILDFTSYGVDGGTVDTAASATDASLAADDSVNVVSFGDITGLDADSNFGNLTAAELAASLGDTAANGAVDSIFMVENDSNAGEYKVFDLNSAEDSTDYTVDLVGTLDFGASQALVDGNIA